MANHYKRGVTRPAVLRQLMDSTATSEAVPTSIQDAFALYHTGQHQQAFAAATAALERRRSPGLLCVAGLSALALRQYAEAETYLQSHRELLPEDPDSHYNLAILFAETGRFDAAEQAYRQAISLKPDDAKALHNLANLYQMNDRPSLAEPYYRRALAANPEHVEAIVSLGVLCQRTLRFAEAEVLYRRALALKAEHVEARFNLGVLLLTLGRYERAWDYYDARTDPRKMAQAVRPPQLPFPRWQGESLVGKRLLIWPEQGFGDEIQFCRYLPLLKALGASRIELVCKPPLSVLMESLAGVDAVIELADATTFSVPDYWTFLLSLPGLLGTTIDAIPNTLPYLAASPERLMRWRDRMPSNGRRVGIVWKGSAAHPNDQRRSLPDLRGLAPLWTVPGIRWISLQKGQGEDEPARYVDSQPLANLGAEMLDFADAAALIAGLDLVIAVDTAIVHLAGALGKPCWVLLTQRDTDWRWLRERDDSPWYPGTLRLFRQQRDGDWHEVISRVRDALTEWMAIDSEPS